MSNKPGQGRPPKPSTIRHRNEQDAFLQTPAKLPPAPRHLTPAERQVWWRVGAELIAARLITQIDLDALAAYARAHVRWVEAHAQLRDADPVIMTANGSVKTNPLYQVADKAQQQMLELMRELGLTPSSRTKLPKRKGEGAARGQPSGNSAAPRGPDTTDPRKLRVVK